MAKHDDEAFDLLLDQSAQSPAPAGRTTARESELLASAGDRFLWRVRSRSFIVIALILAVAATGFAGVKIVTALIDGRTTALTTTYEREKAEEAAARKAAEDKRLAAEKAEADALATQAAEDEAAALAAEKAQAEADAKAAADAEAQRLADEAAQAEIDAQTPVVPAPTTAPVVTPTPQPTTSPTKAPAPQPTVAPPPALATYNKSVTCSGDAQVTFNASGGGTVTLTVSGAGQASTSGAGGASATVSGPAGTYNAHATGTGSAGISWSSNGPCS